MPVHQAHGVRCGNRNQHGEDVVYHANAAAVRECYAESGRFNVESPFSPAEQERIAAAAKAKAEGVAAAAAAEAEEFERNAEQARLKAAQEKRMADAKRYAAWATIPVEMSDYAHYALPSSTGGEPTFYRVRRPSFGEHKGKTFVDLEVGRDTVRMPWMQSAMVLDRIAADPVSAAVLYGKVTTRCAICHRKLKAPESVERGIGPVCLSRMGGTR